MLPQIEEEDVRKSAEVNRGTTHKQLMNIRKIFKHHTHNQPHKP